MFKNKINEFNIWDTVFVLNKPRTHIKSWYYEIVDIRKDTNGRRSFAGKSLIIMSDGSEYELFEGSFCNEEMSETEFDKYTKEKTVIERFESNMEILLKSFSNKNTIEELSIDILKRITLDLELEKLFTSWECREIYRNTMIKLWKTDLMESLKL